MMDVKCEALLHFMHMRNVKAIETYHYEEKCILKFFTEGQWECNNTAEYQVHSQEIL